MQINYAGIEVREWMSKYTPKLYMLINYTAIEVKEWMSNYTP